MGLGWFFLIIVILFPTFSMAALMKSPLDEASCTQQDLIWEEGTCIELPNKMQGVWQHVSSDLKDLSYWTTYIANFEGPKLTFSMYIWKGLPVLASDDDYGRTPLTWIPQQDEPWQEGVSASLSLAGEVAFVHFVPASFSKTAPIMDQLITYPGWEKNDWLVIQTKNFGTHYFNQAGGSVTHPRSEWRREKDDACFQMFTDTTKLDECLKPVSPEHNHIDSSFPTAMIMRARFEYDNRNSRYGYCFLVPESCSLAAGLAKAITDTATTLPFMMNDTVPSEQYEIIRTYTNLSEMFQTTEAALRAQSAVQIRDMEKILDAFAIDGTETMATGVVSRPSSNLALRQVIEAVGVNVGCTVGGFLPYAGPALSIGCGSAGIGDAVSAYLNKELPELPEAQRTATALNSKRFFQALISETTEAQVRRLGDLKKLAAYDIALARMIQKQGLDDLFLLSGTLRDGYKSSMWHASIISLGFLVGDLSLYLQGNPDELGPNSDETCLAPIGVATSPVALETFRMLKEGYYEERQSQGKKALVRFDGTTFENRYRLVIWQVYVGSPVERRPLNAAMFDELRRLISADEIYNSYKDRAYLVTNTQVKMTTKVPRSNASTTQVYKLDVSSHPDLRGIFLRPETQTENYGYLSGAALNPSAGQVFYGIGAVVADSLCIIQ